MHSPALLVLCLLAWFPTVGYAQPADAPVESSEARKTPPDGELFPRPTSSEEDDGSRLRVPRLLLGTTVGGVAGIASGLVGLILGGVLSDCSLFLGSCNDFALLAPTLLGLWAGASGAVYGVGSALEGRGRFLPTLLGGAAGISVGLASSSLTQGELWYLVPALAAVGSVIGYELSHASEPPKPVEDPFASSGLQMMPVVSMTRTGGVLGGLVGRF